MNENELPHYDQSDNRTGCCPRFNPGGWDRRHLHFRDKLFARTFTNAIFHIPTNMGRVFERTFAALEAADALDPNDMVVLSRDLSPWRSEHLFAASRPVPGLEMVKLTGDFDTEVFEGAYRSVGDWQKELVARVASAENATPLAYFFYTTCPRCAKVYGQNFVVSLAETSGHPLAQPV